MVTRSGWCVKDNHVQRIDVKIAWDLGFTRDAKHAYVGRLYRELKNKLGEDCGIIEEVTSACPDEYGKQLSPLFIKLPDGRVLEDLWQEYAKHKDSFWFYPKNLKHVGEMHMYCYHAQPLLPLIRVISVFTDVFYNPEKFGSTQAEGCAVLKLLDQQNKLALLYSANEFMGWYFKYGRIQ